MTQSTQWERNERYTTTSQKHELKNEMTQPNSLTKKENSKDQQFQIGTCCLVFSKLHILKLETC